eukprot:TRINITY_DN609_c0_g1_i1.p1 TRINITY_DN609_c0_g1~~TRINITY_DN609_c0_g1_i1.p1  ORF type:complete len:515 (+),score=126.37 TRINITY_DN609_c0_g1_i1:139-1683(+)
MPLQIGNYNVCETLGEGNFATVKLGVHVSTGHKVAMKVINTKKLQSDDVVRLEREIKILSELDHKHIIRLFEVERTTDKIYLIMELAEGGELFDYIVSRERVREDRAAVIFAQITSAMAYCHRQGVVHRDLKPENLLLDKHNQIKISDFGLCNAGSEEELFHTKCGSPSYAAPEILQGKAYDTAVDIWSMGVILFAIVTGMLPFQDDNIAVLYRKIKSGKYYCPDYVSRDCKDLIGAMLTVEKEKRITVEGIAAHPWFAKRDITIALPRSGSDDLGIASDAPRPDSKKSPSPPSERRQTTIDDIARRRSEPVPSPNTLRRRSDPEGGNDARRRPPAPPTMDTIGEATAETGKAPHDPKVKFHLPEVKVPRKSNTGRRRSVAHPDDAREVRAKGPGVAHSTGGPPSTGSSNARRTEGMRTIIGSSKALATTSTSPAQILREIERVLKGNDIAFKYHQAFELRCVGGGGVSPLKFTLEVCKLENMKNVFQVRARRIQGESWAFKLGMSKILKEMKI